MPEESKQLKLKDDAPDAMCNKCRVVFHAADGHVCGDPTQAQMLERYRPKDLSTEAAANVTEMLNQAIAKGVPVEALEKLTALYERLQDRAAEHEFNSALADFQRHCPVIPKDTEAKIMRKGGGHSHSYFYAKLEAIAAVIAIPLAERGFSYAWDSKVESGMMLVECRLTHSNGHSRKSSFTAPTESPAGMSPQQKFAAAVSFAKRQSLLSVLGITTADADDDAGGAMLTVTEEQQANLQALLDELPNKAEVQKKMLAYYRVDSLERIPLDCYGGAVKALESKRRDA